MNQGLDLTQRLTSLPDDQIRPALWELVCYTQSTMVVDLGDSDRMVDITSRVLEEVGHDFLFASLA